ncbi:hypothetical protein C806_00116 [Lachnospiraceae bacterium 3-1]|nr:hypothetical protein C806_00116 [Lachnospiraceae bacterium 3-1]
MATETMNYGYPKPGEDDFYDINQYNQAMEMIDEDIKEMDEEKQDNLGIGAFKGNIDMLGENGLPQTSSVCWCQAKDLQGVLPYESQNDYCFTLETNATLDNQTASERSQRAIVYGEDGVRIFERLFADGEWCNWRELLCTDGDTKNNIVTFQSGDMENPTEWVDIDPVQSNEKHSSLWRKISLGIKNLRYLKKMLGSTDISKLGDGTITGALSALNTGMKDNSSVATSSTNGMMSASDKRKLDGIATNANNYTHPTSHAANIINQDATHRFVTDTEKSNWNGKAAANHSHSYLPLTGGTVTGKITVQNYVDVGAYAVNFGADAYIFRNGYRTKGDVSIDSASGNVGVSTGGFYVHDRTSIGWAPVYASSFSQQSSKRYKENFSDVAPKDAAKLLKLVPKRFDYISGEKNQSGFIAEDVEEFFPEICSYQEDSVTGQRKLFGIDYSKFAPYIIKLLQMQEERITKLENSNG